MIGSEGTLKNVVVNNLHHKAPVFNNCSRHLCLLQKIKVSNFLNAQAMDVSFDLFQSKAACRSLN